MTLEDRIELSTTERHAVCLIRHGVYPKLLVDRFDAEPIIECAFRRVSKWQLVIHAAIDNNGLQQIAAWYHITPEVVEHYVREVLAEWGNRVSTLRQRELMDSSF